MQRGFRIDRREIINSGGSLVSVSSALRGDPSANGSPNPHRIDVHHHMLPPEYANLTRDRILEITSGDTTVLKWTPEVTIEQMEQFGVASSVLSLPVPGAWYGGKEKSRTLARIANEFGARMAQDYPKRFGTFAAVPLPDVEGSLAEIEYERRNGYSWLGTWPEALIQREYPAWKKRVKPL